MGEAVIWRTIPKYQLYEANSSGQIRRKQHRDYPGRPGKILSNFVDKRKGYIRACVNDYTQSIAPLICQAFHGPKPTPKHQAAHRDGNKSNNRPSNLEWLTQSENYQDQVRHGADRKGERSGQSKLTNEQVRMVRKVVAEGSRGVQRRLSRRLNVSESAISTIVLRKSWTHV